jgi:eukaryotic-like serine/threonine-protein kinase
MGASPCRTMDPQVIVTISSGSLKGQQHSFSEIGTYSIGRDKQRQIAFPDDPIHHNVSRHHCDLIIESLSPLAVTLSDHDSSHGTFHQGRKITTPVTLRDQDLFGVGDILLALRLQEPPPEAPDNQSPVTSNQPRAALPNGVKAIGPKFIALIKNFLEIVPPVAPSSPNPANPQPPEPLKFQDYELGNLIGQGSFSEVYRATHRESGRIVALKVLQPQIAQQNDAVQRFMREIDNTKVLNHPNVVRLIDSQFYQGSFFYATEYCNAGNLAELRKQLGGQLPLAWAKAIITQVLTGLGYTHQVVVPAMPLPNGYYGPGQGLAHRSLKPENILLHQEQGLLQVKISDFALAKSFGSAGLTKDASTFAGTPEFMPRSQLYDYQSARAAGDLWAAMACFYELLTGQPPRDFSRYPDDPLRVIAEVDATPILHHTSYLSPGLAAVVDRALAEDQEVLHYQTAEALLADLATAN